MYFTPKGQELQKRWKNIKDCFRKELNAQRKQPSGSGQRKRRKYIYFDQLLFVLPILEQRATDSNYEPFNEDDEESVQSIDGAGTASATDQNDTSSITEQNASPDQDKESMIARGKKKTSNAGGRKLSFEESLLNILKESKEEEADEDKMFLNSLLSSMKQVPPTKKITLKMNILKCMQEAMGADVAPVQTQFSKTVPYYFTLLITISIRLRSFLIPTQALKDNSHKCKHYIHSLPLLVM